MKQAEIESIAYEIHDYFTDAVVRRLIRAIEEAPSALAAELEKGLRDE